MSLALQRTASFWLLGLLSLPARGEPPEISLLPGAPRAISAISIHEARCAGGTSTELCLEADLTMTYADPDAGTRRQNRTYALDQDLGERLVLDLGGSAPLALREIARACQERASSGPPALQRAAQVSARLAGSMLHYQVLPHVTLPTELELEVSKLAARFYAATKRALVITSGPRTPESQADAMYAKLIQGVSLRRLYRKAGALQEVLQAYKASCRARLRRPEIIAAMAQVMKSQMRTGLFLSPHLKASAVDVRSRNMTSSMKAAFRRAVSFFPQMRLIREERVPPHFHLELNPDAEAVPAP